MKGDLGETKHPILCAIENGHLLSNELSSSTPGGTLAMLRKWKLGGDPVAGGRWLLDHETTAVQRQDLAEELVAYEGSVWLPLAEALRRNMVRLTPSIEEAILLRLTNSEEFFRGCLTYDIPVGGRMREYLLGAFALALDAENMGVGIQGKPGLSDLVADLRSGWYARQKVEREARVASRSRGGNGLYLLSFESPKDSSPYTAGMPSEEDASPWLSPPGERAFGINRPFGDEEVLFGQHGKTAYDVWPALRNHLRNGDLPGPHAERVFGHYREIQPRIDDEILDDLLDLLRSAKLARELSPAVFIAKSAIRNDPMNYARVARIMRELLRVSRRFPSLRALPHGYLYFLPLKESTQDLWWECANSKSSAWLADGLPPLLEAQRSAYPGEPESVFVPRARLVGAGIPPAAPRAR